MAASTFSATAARYFSMSTLLLLLLSTIALTSSGNTSAAQSYPYPPISPGLSFTFYKSSCPNLESIVRNFLKNAIKNDIGLAAGLLRIHFHDCFVQGCDASVLLDGSASGPSEKDFPPNLTLRKTAFKAINDLKALVTQACGQIVSCADIVALTARDSVFLSGGPNYNVPLGRRDGLNFATRNATLASLPPPSSNVTVLLQALATLNLDDKDLVALSGGHTIGIGHCTSFQNRLFPQDPIMEKTFANGLLLTCPALNTDNTTVLDIRSPNAFDNKYYVDLLNRQGLFTSDQDLYTDMRTKPIVTNFAVNQSAFFDQFVYSIVKMGQLSVLTGSKGQIRSNCSVVNPKSQFLWSVADGDRESESKAF